MKVRLSLTAASLILSAASAAGQTPGPPSNINTGGSPRDKSVEEKLRSDEIERVKRDAEKSGARPDAAFPRIKEDFERIQIINNEVLQGQSSAGDLDYARIYEAAAEIKKRAARLSSNLFPDGAARGRQEKAGPGEGAKDLKSLLAELDAAISDFVSNPMFQNLRVVDADSSAKARRDLERVVRLSTKVRQEADKKRKPGG